MFQGSEQAASIFKHLQPLSDDLKSSLGFMQNSQDLEDQWIYYLIDPAGFKDNWDILGIHYESPRPLLLDIQLLHVDEEALVLDDFTPANDASGYVLCSYDGYL